jgi:CTP:molybdopterin cytidylyltransferase MocA
MSNPRTHQIPIVILAAGQSSRMRGADKLLYDVGGLPLIRKQAQQALSVTSAPVLLALPPAPHPRHDAIAGLNVTAVAVPDAAEGMNASLRRVIAALPANTHAAMVLLADLPELTSDDLATVLNAVKTAPDSLVWRGATQDGKPGHPIVFAAPLFNALRTLSGDTGGRTVVEAAQGRVTLVPLPGQRARRDLDTPEAWAEWRASQPPAPL